MSCERNSLKCQAASVASGISSLGSKAGNAVGALNARAGQVSQQISAGVAQADLAADRLGSKMAGAISTVNSANVGKTASTLATTTATVAGAAALVAPAQTKAAVRTVGTAAKAVATNVGPTAKASSGMALGAILGLRSNSKRGFLAKAAMAKIAGKAVPHVATARLAVQAVNVATGSIGSAAGELSKTKDVAEVSTDKKVFFGLVGSKEYIIPFRSKLTDQINSRDVLLSAKNITNSKGVIFKVQGSTWHSGTIKVKMPASGKTRTIAHLQSMAMPASHYYFNKPVSNEQAVGIATGSVKPQDIQGFQGQVSQVESLVKPVADAKHGLIKAGLHWPGKN